MSLTPRITLNDEYTKGKSCAICSNPTLTITHVEKYPDFVSCTRCGAAFVVENEGSWVMYGKIPAEYPLTSQFALRQWTWLDAVAQRAADEREMSSAPSLMPEEAAQENDVVPSEIMESSPAVIEDISPDQEADLLQPAPVGGETFINDFAEDEVPYASFTESIELDTDADLEVPVEEANIESFPEEAFALDDDLPPIPYEPIDLSELEEEDQPLGLEDEDFLDVERLGEKALKEGLSGPVATSERIQGKTSVQEELIAPVREQRLPEEAEMSSEGKPSSIPMGEPEPDKRFRVVIRGSQPKYPKNYCAHCLRTPVRLKAIMRANLPDPIRTGKRKLVPLDLPFCRDCQNRMNAQSEEEKNARLLAFLLSGLVAVIAIVATLILGLINLRENPLPSLIILLIVGILGFSVPLLITLTRANRYPPPRDAAFVLSTLLVNESGNDLTEFEWRNPGYAELFRQVNQLNAVGEVVPTQDRVTFTEIPPEEIMDKKEAQPKSIPSEKPIQEDQPVADAEKNS